MTMKRIMLIFAASAMFAVVGCQSEKELAPKAEDNPTYDPETNTVRTEFVMSISTGTGKDTKSSVDYAQVNGSFLGMEAAHLLAYELPYTSTEKGPFFYKPINGGEAVACKRDFNLGTLLKSGDIKSDQQSRTIELALPLGTNCISLYAKAIKTASNDEQGCTILSGDPNDLSSLKFSLKQRLSSQAAFDAGAFVYSRTINYFLCAGLVNENTFWNNPTGTADKSYKFWYPVPSATVATSLPSNPKDGDTATGSDGVEYTYYTGELSWKQLGRIYDYANDGMDSTDPEKVVYTADSKNHFTLSPLGEVLGEAYSRLTTIKASDDGKYKELRAGSAPDVLHTMNDLYNIVVKATEASPTSWEERAVQLLAEEIVARMKKFFTVNAAGEADYLRTSSGAIDIATMKANLIASCSPNDWSAYADRVNNNFNVSYFYDTPNGYYGFPVNVDLPYGAAIMVCDKKADIKATDSFSYTTDIPAYGFGDAYFPIANYRYEPELMYWGNSPIRVSDQAMKASQYPPTLSTWNTDSWWAGWEKRSTVKSTTRSVAMENNINYGTALLASTVKFADGISALNDNNAALHKGEDDNVIPLGDVKFLVTGIIIGGQPDVVGWDYTRYPDYGAYAGMTFDSSTGHFNVTENTNYANNPFDKMIYARVMSPISLGSSSNVAYTLCWDNYDATKGPDDQNDVYVGLEILNQGAEFWGEMNLVRKNGVFYLLGKLDISTAIETARASNPEAFTNLNRDYYCYPPFDPANGNTINVPRVFMQDYMTTADLVIGADALKHAYVTVPDLRSGQVSLGMSVDVKWTPGLAFTVNMGETD